ncbi:MAG: type I-E CRISPR-associated protein Cse1/CasA [Pseudomonadales bacterium]|nr:type I-E CRISPR-associated protein Cse1/CasA [Pseudomonadales bacterium]
MQNCFNLVDEPWIPIVDIGRVSLRQIFSNPQYRGLGGHPVQKIALMKLLLAIAQAAVTPRDDVDWRELGVGGLAQHCLTYLEQWRERFFLYGEHPFLQMPAIAAASIQSFGAVLPEVSTGNTTVLNQTQVQRSLDDSEKAVLIVVLMAFALAGKKTDNSIVLSPGYVGKRNDKGKPSSSKPGPAVAHMGLLHSFLLGGSLLESLWLNLFTTRQIASAAIFPEGMGIPPWEVMPAGEDCPVARTLKNSLQGRLLPICRFCLLTDKGLHYSEGLAHAGYKEGMADPSVAVNYAGKEPKALWVDPEKRPWRELTSLLGFFEQQGSQGFQSLQINTCLNRARDVTEAFAIWSGGLRVSSNAGEQYASGSDDFVESQIWLDSHQLGQIWFAQLRSEMTALDKLARNLYGHVAAFFKDQKLEGADFAAQATHLFWQLCERSFQELVNNCDNGEEQSLQRQHLRRKFAAYIHQAYDRYCPNETARQLVAWAKCRPNNNQYLMQEP